MKNRKINVLMPDEKQHLRIRLKVALVDVRTGNWSIFSPRPIDNARVTASLWRGAADQKQVERLKKSACEVSAAELVRAASGSVNSWRPAGSRF